MSFERYLSRCGVSRPQGARGRDWLLRSALAMLVWLCWSWLCLGGCAGPCIPLCGNGYRCIHGQCQLDPEGGLEKAITCIDYCEQLTRCQRTTSAACAASQCRPLQEFDDVDREFRLRLYECHLAASCDDIANYLEFQRGFLQSCIGCSRDSHCPGGFRCDITRRICRNSCVSPADCRDTHQCFQGRCQARVP